MNLKELNTVNEIKNFVNGCEVMYYNVKGCMARVDNSFLGKLIFYYAVRNVYYL